MNAARPGYGRPGSEGAVSVHAAAVVRALTVLVLIGVAGGVAQAQTGTHFKGGIGLATTSYRTTDELRSAQHRPLADTTGQPLLDNDKIDLNQGNWHAFLEWYVRPQLAIGLQFQQAFGTRSLALAPSQTATWFGQNYSGATYEEQLELMTWFLTMSWVPVRRAATELGFVGGIGRATYVYHQFVGQDSDMDSMCWFGMMCGGHHGGQFSDVSYVAPAAALAGIFLDLGHTLGVRIGANYMYMPISTLTARQPAGPAKDFSVDGSGFTVYIDVRIAP